MAIITTAKDMYDVLLLQVKKEETSTIYPNQAIWLLNEAGIEWLKENARLVDLNQRQIDDLRDVVVNVPNAPVAANLSALPSDYFQLLNMECKISDTDDCIDNTKWQPVHYLKHDRKSHIRNSSYRRPSVSKIYYSLGGNDIIFEGATVTLCRYDYFQYIDEITNVTNAPTDMSEYSDYVLLEIVDRASRIYLERTQNARYRTILNELALKQQGE